MHFAEIGKYKMTYVCMFFLIPSICVENLLYGEGRMFSEVDITKINVHISVLAPKAVAVYSNRRHTVQLALLFIVHPYNYNVLLVINIYRNIYL